MSTPHSSSDASAPASLAPEPDTVNVKLIVGVGVVSLIVFALSAVVAHVILRRDEAELQQRGVAPLVRGLAQKDEFGIIDAVPFDADRRLDRWRKEKAQALGSYGWVDRKKGIIHIPVEEAMKEVIRTTPAPAGTPASGGRP
jgi:hypothetical protein